MTTLITAAKETNIQITHFICYLPLVDIRQSQHLNSVILVNLIIIPLCMNVAI